MRRSGFCPRAEEPAGWTSQLLSKGNASGSSGNCVSLLYSCLFQGLDGAVGEMEEEAHAPRRAAESSARSTVDPTKAQARR